MHITTYITFPGQAEEAIEFYKKVLGAELILITRMGEGPMEIPPGMKDKIMHARVKIGETVLYFSDTFDNSKLQKGNNTSLALAVDSPGKVDEIFTILSEGGEARMPPNDAFWGSRFSMLVDKFGIQWMVSCELVKVNGQ